MAQIDFNNVTVAYGANIVIDDLSLSIPEKSFFTLLGPSGCGKTTLLRLIAGFVKAKSGTVTFDGEDVSSTPPYARNTGMVFQDYALFPDKTVFDNIAYGLRARNQSDREIHERVTAQLARVELGDFAKRYPNALSGGQKQRVALARSLVVSPRVLLLDEPLSALDAKLAHEMQNVISAIQKEVGVTTIFVTHDQQMALAMSDHVALMRAGGVEQIASPTELFRRPKSVYAADFIGGANILPVTVLEKQNDMAVCDVFGQKITVYSNNFSSGDAVRLCVHRQEAKPILLGAVNGDSENTLQGSVQTVNFRGGQTSYQIRLNAGPLLNVECSNGFNEEILNQGTAVALRLSRACCLVGE